MALKVMRPNGLKTSDHASQKYTNYQETVNEEIEYADIFDPTFWMHHKNLRKLDVIRITRSDDAFDVYVTVRRVIAGGVVMDFHGGRPPAGVDPYKVAAGALTEAMKRKIAPIGLDGKPVIRVGFTPKTQWRLIGIEGNEVKRDIPTREAAEVELAHYLDTLNLRNPTDEELAAHAQARMAKAAEGANA